MDEGIALSSRAFYGLEHAESCAAVSPNTVADSICHLYVLQSTTRLSKTHSTESVRHLIKLKNLEVTGITPLLKTIYIKNQTRLAAFTTEKIDVIQQIESKTFLSHFI